MKGNELIDCIRDEMAAAKNGYIGTLGELMTEYLRLHPEAEASEGKSLQGAYSALRSTALKKQKGGFYAMPPKELFVGLMDYFGFPHAPSDFRACFGALIGQALPDAPATEMSNAVVSEICASISRRHENGGRDRTMDEFDLDTLLEG